MTGDQIVQMAADLASGKYGSVAEAMRGPVQDTRIKGPINALESIADQVSEAVNQKIRTGRLPPVAGVLTCIEDTARQAIADYASISSPNV